MEQAMEQAQTVSAEVMAPRANTCGVAAIEDLTARGVRFGDMLDDSGLPVHAPEEEEIYRKYVRAFSMAQWVNVDGAWTATIPGNLSGHLWYHARAPRLFGAIPKQVLVDFMKQTPFGLPTLAEGSDDDPLGTWIVTSWVKPAFSMEPAPHLTYEVRFIYARPKPDRYTGDPMPANDTCGDS